MTPPGSWILVFVWVWWLQLMLVPAEQQQQQGEGCSATARCGNVTISDPFSLVDIETGSSCAPPDFQVTCSNSTPVLRGTVGFYGFEIINIAYEERTMCAIDVGKVLLLDASSSCRASWNTSVKLGRPFRISDTNLNLILYNCTNAAAAAARRGDGELVETKMKCGNESEMLASVGGRYNETSDNGGNSIEGCDAFVVPVLGSSANPSDYEQLIGQGFLLTWDPPPLPAEN